MTTIKRHLNLAIDYVAFLALAAIYLLANAFGLMDIDEE